MIIQFYISRMLGFGFRLFHPTLIDFSIQVPTNGNICCRDDDP